jgi:hypothetical protein
MSCKDYLRPGSLRPVPYSLNYVTAKRAATQIAVATGSSQFALFPRFPLFFPIFPLRFRLGRVPCQESLICTGIKWLQSALAKPWCERVTCDMCEISKKSYIIYGKWDWSPESKPAHSYITSASHGKGGSPTQIYFKPTHETSFEPIFQTETKWLPESPALAFTVGLSCSIDGNIFFISPMRINHAAPLLPPLSSEAGEKKEKGEYLESYSNLGGPNEMQAASFFCPFPSRISHLHNNDTHPLVPKRRMEKILDLIRWSFATQRAF